MTAEEKEIARLGETIKAHRKKRNMSREALAALTGFDKSHIWRIETGKTNPTVQSISAICKVLEFPMSDVFFEHSKSELSDEEFIELYLSKPKDAKLKIQTLCRWI